MNKTSFCSSCD